MSVRFRELNFAINAYLGLTVTVQRSGRVIQTGSSESDCLLIASNPSQPFPSSMSDKSTPSHPPGTGSTTRGRGRGVPGRARGAPSSAGSETGGHAGRPPPKGKGRKPGLMHGLNPEPIRVFDRICDSDGPNVKIENVQLHGSYSWADTKEPTIFVPGTCSL